MPEEYNEPRFIILKCIKCSCSNIIFFNKDDMNPEYLCNKCVDLIINETETEK